MKRVLFSTTLAALIGFASLSARAEGDGRAEKARRLADAALAACPFPEHIPPYMLGNFERYVGQVLFPELKMLNMAFVRAFNTYGPKNLDLSYCVVTFVGLPNDEYWEKSFSYFDRATKVNTLPQVMFTGFDDQGQVLLQPISRRN